MLKVYNSLTRNLEDFHVDNRNITWYTCGPTVYDSAHLGHARNYVTFDIIRRILENYFGYNVTLTMNITDIDDKIINRATEEGIDFSTLAKKYETEFLEDMKKLNVKFPNVLTRVSEFIPEIIIFIETLIEKKMAYVSNKSVYFDLTYYQQKYIYGKLIPNAVNQKFSVEYSTEKKSPYDFVLWKSTKDGEPFWDSPWGPGRPGWHIECSVMASSIFGSNIDIHSGGEDLKFPHHENELAQSEAFHDSKWVKYFMHSGHLNIDGVKMSKSLKNFIKIKDALKIYTPRQLRMLFAFHSYRSTLTYDDNTMSNVIDIDNKFVKFLDNLKLKLSSEDKKWSDVDKKMLKELNILKDTVDKNLKNDFNVPKALKSLLKFMSISNTHIDSTNYIVKMIYDYYNYILTIIGLDYNIKTNNNSEEDKLIKLIVDYRNETRLAAKSKDLPKIFKLSDEIRDIKLPNLGIKLIDVNGTSQWKR